MGRGTMKKIFILLWKNLLIKKRHWVMSILEVVIPTVLFMAIVALRAEGGEQLNPQYKNATVPKPQFYPLNFCTALLTVASNGTLLNSTLAFYPNSQHAKEVMKEVQKAFSTLSPLCVELGLAGGGGGGRRRIFGGSRRQNEREDLKDIGTFSVVGVDSEQDIEVMANENSYDQDPSKPVVFGGVVFPEDFSTTSNLSYTLRLSSTSLPATGEYTQFLFLPYQLSGPQPNPRSYALFTALQTLIELAYVQIVTGEKLLVTDPLPSLAWCQENPIRCAMNLTQTDVPRWLMFQQEMPYPSYFSNNLTLLLGFIMPLFLVLSFTFIVPPILKRIVYEKETGVKELMKMMGLPAWMHWVCWYINCIVVASLSIFIMVLLLSISFKEEAGAVLQYSNPLLTFLFLFLYASALIIFLFIISTFFNRPNLALSLGVLIHILTYIIPNNSINRTMDSYTTYSFPSKMALGVLPNINLIWGIKMLMSAESRGTGLQWDNIFTRADPEDPLTMGAVWLMFLFDCLFFGLVIAYMDTVAPGKYGVAKPWYFPLQFLRRASKIAVDSGDPTSENGYGSMGHGDATMFEKEPVGEAGIRVAGLKKEFPRWGAEPVRAVQGVTFAAFPGEITTLLGHNGAGKTTTMSVLTGLYSPTAGEATVGGHSIRGGMGMVRKSLGLCPQHNMLFEDLTVREHLVFFGMLKGMTKSAAEADSTKYISMLNLEPKRNVIVTSLSGGMKRKVNLGIALIGDSKVVMLDEPTSGMDPEARRGMWDLLTSLKRDRTILLTTHFMEEADVLGDRIAIMARGRVQCYGSPFFLKQRLGSGYSLHLTKSPGWQGPEVVQLVQGRVPGASLTQESKEEAVMLLPASCSALLPDMLEVLEEAQQKLGVEGIGLTITTMDDVFLKIGEMTEGQDEHVPEITDNTDAPQKSPPKVSGLALARSQLVGLLSKRATYTARRWTLYSVMMLIPIAMAVLVVLSLNPFTGSEKSRPNREITLDAYMDPVSFVGSDGSLVADNLSKEFAASLGVSSGTVYNSSDVVEDILARANGSVNLANYRDKFIIGAAFANASSLSLDLPSPFPPSLPFQHVQLTALYNSVPIHARPLAQLHASNTLLRVLEAGNKTKHSIALANHPLPQPKTTQFETVASNGVDMLTYAFGITLPMGLAILISSFLIFPLSERATSAKQVQIMTGLHPAIFWASNVMWDLLLYLVPSLFMLTMILVLDEKDTFLTYGSWAAFLLMIVLLGVFGTPFSYVFSFLANNAASGFALLIIVNVLAGCIAPTAVFMLRDFGSQFDSEDLVQASDIVRWIFNWFPIFPFARGLMAITTVQQANNLCATGIELDTLEFLCKKFIDLPQTLLIPGNAAFAKCCLPELVPPEVVVCGKDIIIGGYVVVNATMNKCHEIESFFTWDPLRGINLDITMLILDGFLFFLILVLIETAGLSKIWSWIKDHIPGYYSFDSSYEELDDDVRKEQERVRGPGGTSDILQVFGLQKKFRHLEAVRQLSFGVQPGECFGLLGINGAGKTTTFRMLTGDEVPSAGSASVLGSSLHNSRRKFLSQVGYCPQFDSIIPQLTGRELLRLMCRCRGVAPEGIEAEVERWTSFLGIQEYIDRQSGSYSGGNKRKLNVAMTLAGEPPLVFLDEPSTGVDPVARRNLWTIIGRIQKNGQSVVLTSHSMEECEHLCDRLAIMVNGQFQCFGSSSHLKNKFAQGFTILTKLRSTGVESDDEEVAERLKKWVVGRLEDVQVKDEHASYIHFHVASPSTPWHRLFRVMEGARGELEGGLEEYSITQTTLEQVFLSFAKKQQGESK